MPTKLNRTEILVKDDPLSANSNYDFTFFFEDSVRKDEPFTLTEFPANGKLYEKLVILIDNIRDALKKTNDSDE
jgi:hypothetical protein